VERYLRVDEIKSIYPVSSWRRSRKETPCRGKRSDRLRGEKLQFDRPLFNEQHAAEEGWKSLERLVGESFNNRKN